MGLEANIKTLLGPLVGGRCYPDIVPDGKPTFPLVVYQRVGGLAIEFVDKTLPDKDHVRLQVVVWSATRLEATQIARQAREALVGSDMAVETYGAPVSLYDEALKKYGARTDFGIWHTP